MFTFALTGRWDCIGFAFITLHEIELYALTMILSYFRLSTNFYRKTPTIERDPEECASHTTVDAVKHATRGNVVASESLKIEFIEMSIKNRSFQNLIMELYLRHNSEINNVRKAIWCAKNFGFIITCCSGS